MHLLALAGCVLLTALRVVADASAQAQALDGLLVQTTSGLVQGFLDTNTTDVPLKKWLGVPYADDTSGQNRWRPPQSVKVKPGRIIDATAFGPACMQGRYVLRLFCHSDVQAKSSLELVQMEVTVPQFRARIVFSSTSWRPQMRATFLSISMYSARLMSAMLRSMLIDFEI